VDRHSDLSQNCGGQGNAYRFVTAGWGSGLHIRSRVTEALATSEFLVYYISTSGDALHLFSMLPVNVSECHPATLCCDAPLLFGWALLFHWRWLQWLLVQLLSEPLFFGRHSRYLRKAVTQTNTRARER